MGCGGVLLAAPDTFLKFIANSTRDYDGTEYRLRARSYWFRVIWLYDVLCILVYTVEL